MKALRTQMRWIMVLIVVFFLLSTFLMYDSGSRGGSGSSGQMKDYAVAEINGRKVMRSEIEQLFASYYEQSGRRELASTDVPFIYKAALDQYALQLQMDKEVRESGIQVSDAEADQAMKNYADLAYPTREAFYQYLQSIGQKPEDYKRDVARQIASERWMEGAIGTVAVSEDESVQFYDNMKDLFFKQPAGFKISMANFASREDAEKIRDLLLAGTAWAEATSGDVVASMDLLAVTPEPMFVPDSTVSERLVPVKELPLGEVGPVIELGSEDFAVAVKNEIVEENVTPYAEVSADIRAMLQQQKEYDAVNRFYQGLLDRAHVVIIDESLFPAASPILPVTEVADTSASVSADTPVVSGE